MVHPVHADDDAGVGEARERDVELEEDIAGLRIGSSATAYSPAMSRVSGTM